MFGVALNIISLLNRIKNLQNPNPKQLHMVVISSQVEENAVTLRHFCEPPDYYLDIGTGEKVEHSVFAIGTAPQCAGSEHCHCVDTIL